MPQPLPDPAARRRAMRVALRLGIVMLASGAQTREVETALRLMLEAFGLAGAHAVITHDTVTASYITPDGADPVTAVEVVRRWEPDYHRLAVAADLVNAIRARTVGVDAAEAEIGRIETARQPYPPWFRFAAPALLSMAVTIMFGGSAGDAVATLAIGIAVQPALQRIERSELTSFFQVVFGVTATALLVVLLVWFGVPVNGGLVLTGGLLRFLPGAALVAGMHDLLDGALLSGVARMAQVALHSAAIAAAASLVLALGLTVGVRLQITTAGGVEWSPAVLVAAGAAAVTCYACRVGVPARVLASCAALGAVAVVLGQGLTPVVGDLLPPVRTLVAALVIGVVGRWLARRSGAPAALWMVPAILPLLPAPSTLLPMLAGSGEVRRALENQAVQTAFAIGVGVASGSIVLETYLRYRARLLDPVVGVVADGLSTRVVGPVAGWVRRRRRPPDHAGTGDVHDGPV